MNYGQIDLAHSKLVLFLLDIMRADLVTHLKSALCYHSRV